MLIDHIGFVFFPENYVFNAIGRLSFPLFAWLIANGSIHTKNMQHYILKLAVFAVISQVPFLLMARLHDDTFRGINVMATLLLGLITIGAIHRTTNRLISACIIIATSSLAQILGTDYGMIGVLSVVVFYMYRKDESRMVLLQTILLALPSFADVLFFNRWSFFTIQPVSLLSLLLIALYNGKEGPKTSYYLYLFYPVHMTLLYIIATYLY